MSAAAEFRIDSGALAKVREVLDRSLYALVDFRLGLEAPVAPTGFPRPDALGAVVARLDPATCTLFRLFRLGEAVDEASLGASPVAPALEAFVQTGLLRRTGDGGWRTPDLLLVPLEGLYLFVSTPPSYPTTTRAADVWFDLSTYVVARSLPRRLDGRRVLDLCCGSGVQGLLCAARGARSTLGLDISPAAIAIAALNAALNGLADRAEFRLSDGPSALDPEDRFDLVLCNTPHAPMVRASGGATGPEEIGNAVLMEMIDEVARAVAPGGAAILATWRSAGRAGQTAQHLHLAQRLAAAGIVTRAFVERAPDTRRSVLDLLAADAARSFGAERAGAIVAAAERLLEPPAVDGFYNQILCCERAEPATEPATFGLDLQPAGTA